MIERLVALWVTAHCSLPAHPTRLKPSHPIMLHNGPFIYKDKGHGVTHTKGPVTKPLTPGRITQKQGTRTHGRIRLPQQVPIK